MTEINIQTRRPAAPRQRAVASAYSRQSGLNNVLAWMLVIFVALVPVPFGSARPFFWALNATLVGLAGAFYAIRLIQLGEAFHFGFRRMRLSAALFALVGLYLVVQAVPLQQIPSLGEFVLPYLSFVTPAGSVITPGSISIAPGATWLMLLRWGTFGVFFFLVLQISGNDRRRALLLHAALAIISFYAVFGLASLLQFGDTILGMPKWAYEGAATATFVNRNSYATFLAFGAALSVALIAGALVQAPDGPGERDRVRIDPMILIYLVALAAIVPALLATQSRMGTFAAAGGCAAIIVAALFRMPGLWLRVLLLVPVLVLSAGAAFYFYGQSLLERLGSVESSADVRLDLYAQVLQMIAVRPYLGFGGGSFEVAFVAFHQPPVSPDLVWDRAHNTYLALWAELGVVAGSIPLLLFALMLAAILRGMSRARQEWPAKAAGLGVIVVAALHSITDFSLEIDANAIMLLFIAGTAVAATVRSSSKVR